MAGPVLVGRPLKPWDVLRFLSMIGSQKWERVTHGGTQKNRVGDNSAEGTTPDLTYAFFAGPQTFAIETLFSSKYRWN